ncbi:DUF6378 domain-containing protein [Gilvimarinus agarilyticus]|uniref:DUF6378 domain-containing protein n=1 Tax=Gilvimarinus agarilyticus TaxID=679259 RepID=UPI0018DB54EF|nr:DUF6378 domain-containing protein [Gilvimarinus agarilyticus]
MKCVNCSTENTQVPLDRNGTEFVGCTFCRHDVATGLKWLQWCRATNPNKTHQTPEGAGEPNLQPDWSSLDMAIDPDAHIEQPAAATETPAPEVEGVRNLSDIAALEFISRLDITKAEQPAATETPAPQFLEAAANHMRNRAKQRDSQGGERSMAKTVAAFNTIYGQQLTEEQGWQFMTLLKMTRSAHGIYVQDDYEDGAAYFALAGETASRGRE